MSNTPTHPEPAVTPVSYSVDDAARALGLSRSFIFRLIREGRIASVKLGRRRVVAVKECSDFLARCGGAV